MNLLHLKLIIQGEAIPFYRVPQKRWFRPVYDEVGMYVTKYRTLIPHGAYKKISRVKVIDSSRRVEISFQKEPSLQKMLCILGKDTPHDKSLPNY